MSVINLAAQDQTEKALISPDYVRISMAAAIQLGLKPGKLQRGAICGCINLLQNYPEGCYSNCSYCGLARERPGRAEDNTFIRVAWPLYETDLVAEKIAEYEDAVGRVCISQVQDHRAYDDLIDMIKRVRSRSDVLISGLVSATTLNTERLLEIQKEGVDIIGVGMDAASKEVFNNTRGKATRSPHTWDYHWHIVREARRIYGPMKVNCHIVVGLGETDRDLINMFYLGVEEQIAMYLFSFNPEPGTAMENQPRAPMHRWRRVQLVKYLIENEGLDRNLIEFGDEGNLLKVNAPDMKVEVAINTGLPFMTNGCPDKHGEVACNRPYGSYRPSEEYRDYPFVPEHSDLIQIRQQMRLEEIW